MDKKKVSDIDTIVFYFYSNFYNRVHNMFKNKLKIDSDNAYVEFINEVALELTKEAMATYRTYMIHAEKNKLTEKQKMKILGMTNKEEAIKLAKDLFGKDRLEDLTKSEASILIDTLGGDKYGSD